MFIKLIQVWAGACISFRNQEHSLNSFRSKTGKPQMAMGALPKESFVKAITDVLQVSKTDIFTVSVSLLLYYSVSILINKNSRIYKPQVFISLSEYSLMNSSNQWLFNCKKLFSTSGGWKKIFLYFTQTGCIN